MTALGCAPCGRGFTSLGAFDQHQDVDYSRRPAVRCQDPATVGLVMSATSGRWGWPVPEAARARFATLRDRAA